MQFGKACWNFVTPASGIRKRESGEKPQLLDSGPPLSDNSPFATGPRYRPRGSNGVAKAVAQAREKPQAKEPRK